jgi:glycerol uptake facilitator-like aquaporin
MIDYYSTVVNTRRHAMKNFMRWFDKHAAPPRSAGDRPGRQEASDRPVTQHVPYVVAQVVGTFDGVDAAHLMFDAPTFVASAHVRTGAAQWWSEFVATFGLIAVIIGCSRSRPGVTPFAVAAYITAAYWFTSSTSFANPAVTLARSATDTFAGIRPADVFGSIVAQLLGAAAATPLFCWLYPAAHREASVAGTVAQSDFTRAEQPREVKHG